MAAETARLTGLLTLGQWLSPAFPLGAFAHSHGLEWSITRGDVRTARDLQDWLSEVLAHGAGRNDAVLLAHALRCDCPVGLSELCDLARALCASRERQAETEAQGEAFVRTVLATQWGACAPEMARHLGPRPPLPVALGALARPLGLPVRTVLALYLQSFVSNLIIVGVRFIPLGQSEGQASLQALRADILACADQAEAASLDDLGGAFLRGDLAAMHHETLETRIFAT